MCFSLLANDNGFTYSNILVSIVCFLYLQVVMDLHILLTNKLILDVSLGSVVLDVVLDIL